MLIWMAQGTAIVAVLMFVLWLLHIPMRNSAIADVGWATGMVLIAIFYAMHGAGYWRRVLILMPMIVIWGFRLALYLLFARVNGQAEDGRYAELRRRWGSKAGLKFLLLFELQALLCGVLSLPFLLAMHDPAKGLPEVENAGAWIWGVAFLGETIADAQLALFLRNPKNSGKVCNAGLWRYSRHPNYFFEFFIWVGFAVVACTAQYGPWAFAAPVLMLFLLLRVTGIRATEAQALRSLGGAYKKYQESTSAFVPWFPDYR